MHHGCGVTYLIFGDVTLVELTGIVIDTLCWPLLWWNRATSLKLALTMLTPLDNDETGYFTNPVMLFAVREKDDADQTQVLQPAELQQVL